MHRYSLPSIIAAIIFCFIHSAQAQQQLPQPQNIRVVNDAVVWNAVENASGYLVQWIRAAGRLRIITVEVTQNSFSMSEFQYGENYYVQVQAVSKDKTAYQDSRWTVFSVLVRPWPTPTPTNTPTDTPTPTPTRVVLRGLSTPQNLRSLLGATVAWDAVAEAIGYKLLLSGDGAQHLISVDAPQTEYTFANLRPGVEYAVLVSALGDGRVYESQGRWSSFIRISLPIAATDAPTATHTITNTPIERPTYTATSRPTATSTIAPTAASTATPTPRPTNTSTYTPTATHTATETPSATYPATNTPKATSTAIPTSRPTNVATDSPTETVSPPPTVIETATATQARLRRLPPPENFRVLSGNTVAWDAVEGASRYRVRLDPPNADRILKRVDPPQTQYTFENLQAGLVYRVRVRAIGDEVVYQLLGDWSVTLNLIPGATVEPTATETALPTDRPTNTATFTPTNTATFTATDRPSNTPTDTPTNTATFTPTDIPTNTPTDTPPPTDTPSPTATDTQVPLCELSRPKNLVAIAETTVAWDAVENAAGYRLRWRLAGNDWLTTRLSAEHRAYQFAELQVGGSYEVQVQALGDGVTCEEEGEWSRALPFTLHPTVTPTDTPTYTPTFTPTNTPTDTPTHTPTFTPIPTNTPTFTPTFTLTPTPVPPTSTYTPTFTPTYTLTPTLIPPTATSIPSTATPVPPTAVPTKIPKTKEPKRKTSTPEPKPSDTQIPTRIPPATATDIPPSPKPITYTEYTNSSGEKRGSGGNAKDARKSAENAARKSVSRCNSGDQQISSWITYGHSGQESTSYFWATATAFIKCRKSS